MALPAALSWPLPLRIHAPSFYQVLYEDSSSNRMDEAVTLFKQICNHDSFKKTSMILFLNKRDLFEIKLEKDKRDHPLTVWDPDATTGRNYDDGVRYIVNKFLALNKDPISRQARQINLPPAIGSGRLLGGGQGMLDAGGGSGRSGVKTGAGVWTPSELGKVILCAAYYTDDLSERKASSCPASRLGSCSGKLVTTGKVLVTEGAPSDLPGVEMMTGGLKAEDMMWLMELGKEIPVLPISKGEIGSFKGNFKQACVKLRELLGLGPEGELGFLYDQPIVLEHSRHTMLVCVKRLRESSMLGPWGHGFKGIWVTHEDFENPHYKKYANVHETVHPPAKGEEFNPFAANPVGWRWFKGVTLFTAAASKIPDKGVYLGIVKVLSTTTGFKIMVNEHNRIMIPLIFLTENQVRLRQRSPLLSRTCHFDLLPQRHSDLLPPPTHLGQLSEEEKVWMHGVRIREQLGIDLLEGRKPNMGWLGPEMSGEEGATFKEKLAWAVSEAKSRLGLEEKEPLGLYYDSELLQ
ncbi:MAG: hypothetical protein SGPRY_009960, partial [Prymnesium sp.]